MPWANWSSQISVPGSVKETADASRGDAVAGNGARADRRDPGALIGAVAIRRRGEIGSATNPVIPTNPSRPVSRLSLPGAVTHSPITAKDTPSSTRARENVRGVLFEVRADRGGESPAFRKSPTVPPMATNAAMRHGA